MRRSSFLRVDLEGFLVVVAHADAGRQSRGVHEPAIGQDGQLIARSKRDRDLFHLAPIALDVAAVERAHHGLPELAVAARLLGDEEDPAHRAALGRAGEPTTVTPAATSARTSAPAPTTASLPTVTPGIRTAARADEGPGLDGDVAGKNDAGREIGVASDAAVVLDDRAAVHHGVLAHHHVSADHPAGETRWPRRRWSSSARPPRADGRGRARPRRRRESG